MVTDNPGWAAWRGNYGAALDAYVAALLWDSQCNGTGGGRHDGCAGEDCDMSLEDMGFTPGDIVPGAARELDEDLHDFITSCLSERPDAFVGITADMVGHDFYMTRNGHGVGFWDRGLGEPGKWLTGMAKPFGESRLHVGTDNLVYCE